MQFRLLDVRPGVLWRLSTCHREGRHASQKIRAFVDLAVERLRANAAIR